MNTPDQTITALPLHSLATAVSQNLSEFNLSRYLLLVVAVAEQSPFVPIHTLHSYFLGNTTLEGIQRQSPYLTHSIHSTLVFSHKFLCRTNPLEGTVSDHYCCYKIHCFTSDKHRKASIYFNCLQSILFAPQATQRILLSFKS